MGTVIKGSKVAIMGLTYKENVPDCVIITIPHDEFRNKRKKEAFSERTTFLEENFPFLSTGSFFRKKVLNDNNL